jgi:hypothetical protein
MVTYFNERRLLENLAVKGAIVKSKVVDEIVIACWNYGKFLLF